MSNNQTLNTTAPAADTPQPTTKLTPEAIIEQIRAMRSQVDDVTPLDKAQRQQLKQRARRQPAPVVEASISVINSSGTVAQAVGQPAEEVLQLQSDVARWALAAAELHSFFQGIEGSEPGPPGTACVHRIAGVLVRIAARAKPGERGTAASGGGDSASEDCRAPQEGAGSDARHVNDAAGIE
jgi:hypothetical protein